MKTAAEIQAIIDADVAYMNAGAEHARMHEPGSEFCEQIGFTKAKFLGYLYEDGEICWLSLVVSKEPGQGNLSRVLKNLRELGMEVRVPTPSSDMEMILTANGYEMHVDAQGGREMRSPPRTAETEQARRGRPTPSSSR